MFEKMKRKISGATAFTIGVYIVLFLWLVYPIWWMEFLGKLPTWVEMIKWAFPLVLGSIAYFFVILDIHNWIDNKFYKERKKVNDYIRSQLIIPCTETPCAKAKEGVLGEEKQKLIGLFYTFIPKDDTWRELAFSYWGEYFIMVNLSFISILGFVGALISLPFDLSRGAHPAFLIILAFLLLFNFARIRTRKKLLYPAQAQTTRILSASLDQLKKMLPKYRSQCRECPLGI